MSQATSMIELQSVNKWYGPTFQVLTNCSLNVAKGEVVVICGPSGSGKSTLIKCVNALETIGNGIITVNGVEVTNPKTDMPKLRSKVGMVFQHFELFPHMTILENLCIGQEKVLGRSPAEALVKANALLERVGLTAHAKKYPGQLSGGQQQRVAIARALALDPEMINEVLDVMVSLAQEGMTMMVVTHEMGFARKVADRIVFMDGGEIVEIGEGDSFFTNPKTDRARSFLSKILAH